MLAITILFSNRNVAVMFGAAADSPQINRDYYSESEDCQDVLVEQRFSSSENVTRNIPGLLAALSNVGLPYKVDLFSKEPKDVAEVANCMHALLQQRLTDRDAINQLQEMARKLRVDLQGAERDRCRLEEELNAKIRDHGAALNKIRSMEYEHEQRLKNIASERKGMEQRLRQQAHAQAQQQRELRRKDEDIEDMKHRLRSSFSAGPANSSAGGGNAAAGSQQRDGKALKRDQAANADAAGNRNSQRLPSGRVPSTSRGMDELSKMVLEQSEQRNTELTDQNSTLKGQVEELRAQLQAVIARAEAQGFAPVVAAASAHVSVAPGAAPGGSVLAALQQAPKREAVQAGSGSDEQHEALMAAVSALHKAERERNEARADARAKEKTCQELQQRLGELTGAWEECSERVVELEAELQRVRQEVEDLRSTHSEQPWLQEEVDRLKCLLQEGQAQEVDMLSRLAQAEALSAQVSASAARQVQELQQQLQQAKAHAAVQATGFRELQELQQQERKQLEVMKKALSITCRSSKSGDSEAQACIKELTAALQSITAEAAAAKEQLVAARAQVAQLQAQLAAGPRSRRQSQQRLPAHLVSVLFDDSDDEIATCSSSATLHRQRRAESAPGDCLNVHEGQAEQQQATPVRVRQPRAVWVRPVSTEASPRQLLREGEPGLEDAGDAAAWRAGPARNSSEYNNPGGFAGFRQPSDVFTAAGAVARLSILEVGSSDEQPEEDVPTPTMPGVGQGSVPISRPW
mmetsp:Transcript_12596/g.27218  ORF Transcript_12596/g.27218 Transcript_12596/m.27218 type:complete len:749 (+) Transcript_12596:60-2306(+)